MTAGAAPTAERPPPSGCQGRLRRRQSRRGSVVRRSVDRPGRGRGSRGGAACTGPGRAGKRTRSAHGPCGKGRATTGAGSANSGLLHGTSAKVGRRRPTVLASARCRGVPRRWRQRHPRRPARSPISLGTSRPSYTKSLRRRRGPPVTSRDAAPRVQHNGRPSARPSLQDRRRSGSATRGSPGREAPAEPASGPPGGRPASRTCAGPARPSRAPRTAPHL